MNLFDDFQRTDMDYAGYGEPEYAYLNRSARPVVKKVRDKMSEWFDLYPSSEQVRLLSDINTDDYAKFCGGFTELYCHEILRRQQYTVIPHPNISIPKFLDFEAKRDEETQFYLECTVASEYGEGSTAAKRLNQIYAALNSIHLRDFFLGVVRFGAPPFTPSLKRMIRSIQEHTDGIDPDSAEFASNAHLVEQKSPYYWEYEEQGWKMGFWLIAKKEEARGKDGVRPLGTFSDSHAKRWDSKKPFMKSLKRKATKYGELGKPYIIAIDVMDIHLDEIDILNVLFGDIVTQINRKTLEARDARLHNGFWRGPKGVQNTRVSGVLILPNMGPWSVGSKTPELWHNPWAAHPLDPALWAMPQKILNKEQNGFDAIEGITSGELFQIADNWLKE